MLPDTVTLADTEEMEEVRLACAEANDDDHNGRNNRRSRCFTFVYPLSWTMPDGSVITIEDREGRTALREWYESNPDVDGRPVLVYPLDVVLANSDTLSIVGTEEMEELRVRCANRRGRRHGG